MLMRNARQAIHDAFALHVTGGDMIRVGSSTKFDSDRAIYEGMKAGLIIRAVLEQRTYLRGCALFLNAHDNVVQQAELYSLKLKLWLDFQRRVELDHRASAEVVALSDHLILGHKYRVWDHRSERLSVHQIAKAVAGTQKAHRRVVRNCNIYLDCLSKLDNEALRPVWDVINDQREKRNAAADKTTT